MMTVRRARMEGLSLFESPGLCVIRLWINRLWANEVLHCSLHSNGRLKGMTKNKDIRGGRTRRTEKDIFKLSGDVIIVSGHDVRRSGVYKWDGWEGVREYVHTF